MATLCFDFVVDTPHADLLDIFEAMSLPNNIQEYSWSICHDTLSRSYLDDASYSCSYSIRHRYRTPLCLLFPARIIAAACCLYAQCIADGPQSASLDARISVKHPRGSLPTPPSPTPTSPDAMRSAVEFFALDEDEIRAISGP